MKKFYDAYEIMFLDNRAGFSNEDARGSIEIDFKGTLRLNLLNIIFEYRMCDSFYSSSYYFQIVYFCKK